jgi:hypothetical protein
MALATRPKPAVHHRKRQAQHHRHSKTYVKAYWPYLPMLAIVGAGAIVNQALYSMNLDSTGLLAASAPLASTRVQALTGNQAGWVLYLLILVTFAAAAVFIVRHSRRLQRLLTKSEAFVSDRPLLDIATVLVFTAGFVLTRVIPS